MTLCFLFCCLLVLGSGDQLYLVLLAGTLIHVFKHQKMDPGQSGSADCYFVQWSSVHGSNKQTEKRQSAEDQPQH